MTAGALVGALVLAAGNGVRLGGPKALLLWPVEGGEEALALVQLRARVEAESDLALLVTRAPHAAALIADGSALPEGSEIVVSTAPDELGPAGSIAAASAHFSRADLWVVTPVDCPPVRPETVARLVEAASKPGIMAARPRSATLERRGHPVVLCAAALKRYAEPEPPPLRDVLRELGSAVVDVEVDDDGIVADVDRPEDLLRFGIDTPRFIST
ncbi:NTP transferase domain-containing protein [Endomicrobium sp. AH-315-J14]|nr:NTP transferase domain-containing protein [Endomicrobium sp. AH-315-J14]